MRLFDTHTHMNDKAFDADRGAVLDGLAAAGVERIIDVACDMRSVERTLPLLDGYDFVYGSVGMHPHDASAMTEAYMRDIARHLEHPKMVALGEIGLDYHYDLSPRDVQRRWFAAQLELAQQLDVPVILHVREAFGDAMDILRAHRAKLKGVMHCFSGSYETARECIDMGLYIAFGGALTFKNAVKSVEAAARLPLERLLIETDCPYLTPVPYRSRRNDPSRVGLVAERLAEARKTDAGEVAEATYKNACGLFGIPCR